MMESMKEFFREYRTAAIIGFLLGCAGVVLLFYFFPPAVLFLVESLDLTPVAIWGLSILLGGLMSGLFSPILNFFLEWRFHWGDRLTYLHVMNTPKSDEGDSQNKQYVNIYGNGILNSNQEIRESPVAMDGGINAEQSLGANFKVPDGWTLSRFARMQQARDSKYSTFSEEASAVNNGDSRNFRRGY